jgi:hypothetical protein
MININDNNTNSFLHIQLLGMVNALKTGDPTVGMLLAMMFPYLVSIVSKDLLKWLKKLFASAPTC